MNKPNRQYSYTSRSYFNTSIIEKPGWLLIKSGQTIEKSIDERVKEQDTASTADPLLVVSRLVIHDNDDKDLDNKIREITHLDYNFEAHIRYDGKRNERSWVRIHDLVEGDCNCADLLNDKEFLERLNDRIHDVKNRAALHLLGRGVSVDIVLRIQQEHVLEEMIVADKKYNLLGLPPRFGKTYLILEYAQRYTDSMKDIVLLVASKNLSSNSSFETSFRNSVYADRFHLRECSLFQPEETIDDILSENIKPHHNVFLVTDEADLGSHTEKSRAKLAAIEAKYNVVKHIVMSGTNINTANKIIRGVSSEENTYSINMSYTDMMEMTDGVMMVKRHFKDIKLDMGASEAKLNIIQSFADADHYPEVANYVDKFIGRNDNLDLTENNVTMVFVNTERNSHLQRFVNHFKEDRSDTIETMIITSAESSNRTAEQDVKKKLAHMKRHGNTKSLVIFSRQMASRSFSITEIDRVVVFKDGLISSADYQKMSRCLTWINGKSRADIIRVSFSALGLAENLFLIEHESIVNESHETQISKGHRFFEGCNAFTSYDMSKTGKVTAKNALDVEIIIENMIKHARETEYTLGKLWDADIVVDIDAGKVTEDTSITKSNKTAPETKLSFSEADEEPKVKDISDSDRMKYLRTQSIIVQVLPLILDTKFNVQSVDDIGIIDED